MATQLKEPEGEPLEPQTEEPQSGASEAEARLLGWKPEAEYTGSAPWIDADAFMGKRNEHLGLANKRIEQLNVQLRKQDSQIKRLIKAEQNSYTNALADIRKEMRVAVQTGDEAAFAALEQRADTLRQDMAVDAPQSGEDPTVVFETFRNDNAWYDKAALASAREDEVEARLYADKRLRQLSREAGTENLSGATLFDRVQSDFATLEKEISEQFPTLKMKAARTKPPSDVAGVTNGAGRTKTRTGANLPTDAKDTAERYVRLGIPGYKGKTKAEAYEVFARHYEWDA